MTELLTTTPDRPKRRNGAAPEVLVSATALGAHLGMTRQSVAKLTLEGIIERRGDGYDRDACRLRYIAHIREERRRSPRAAADAEFALAKAELVRMRIAEKKRELIPQEEAFGQMEQLVGLFLTGLSGFAARCGGRDLAAPRAIDKAVHDLRLEISEACTKQADARGEPQDADEP